jgi:hypothetical protein
MTMTLANIQWVRDGDPARVAAGHSEADIDALGEPGAGPVKPCACGEGCTFALRRPYQPCGGSVTAIVYPGAFAYHLCAVHLVGAVAASDTFDEFVAETEAAARKEPR